MRPYQFPRFPTRTRPGASPVLYRCAECGRWFPRADVTLRDGLYVCDEDA